MKVSVDDVMCQAHGLCVARAPRVFELPDDAAVARVRPDVLVDGELPSGLEHVVTEAAADCPEQAVLVSGDH